MAVQEKKLLEIPKKQTVTNIPFPGAENFKPFHLYTVNTIIFNDDVLWRSLQSFMSGSAFDPVFWEQIAINQSTIDEGGNYLQTQIDSVKNILNGTGVIRLNNTVLTRVINGISSVPISNLSETQFSLNKTVIGDENGTLGVYVGNSGVSVSEIIVQTVSISPISQTEPSSHGSVNLNSDLPLTVSAAIEIGWITPKVDDYVRVRADETMSDQTVEWYIVGIDGNGNITWGNPVVLNVSDFQEQTSANDGGRLLTGGIASGTFGASKTIDDTIVGGSTGIPSTQAVYDGLSSVSSRKTVTVVIGTELSGHAQRDVDYLCTGSNDDVTINQAIQSLPVNGGIILIREGQYNITNIININIPCVTIQGTGRSTKIFADLSMVGNDGMFTVNAPYCVIKELYIGNNTNINITNGICVNSDYCNVINVTIETYTEVTVGYGINLRSANHCNISGCIIANKGDINVYGIAFSGNYNIIFANIIRSKKVTSQTTTTTFAFYFTGVVSNYNRIINNDLTGITRDITPGSQLTQTGNTAVALPGSGISAAIFIGTSSTGMSGFNIV